MCMLCPHEFDLTIEMCNLSSFRQNSSADTSKIRTICPARVLPPPSPPTFAVHTTLQANTCGIENRAVQILG
jgi:hypothetical protein